MRADTATFAIARGSAMKMKKYWFAAAGGLLCFLLLVQPSPAGPSKLLSKGRQAVNVTATSDSSGVISNKSVSQIMPDGSVVPFHPDNGTANTNVVINQIFAAFFYGANPPPDGPVIFQFGPFYSLPGTMNGGSVGFEDNLDPGIAIGQADFSFRVVDANNVTIPGALTIRGVGYLTPLP